MAKKKKAKETRQERRFVARSAMNPWVVKILGALGALGLGAGAFGYFYGESFKKAADAAMQGDKLAALPSYLIAAGAVLTGVAIWLGTSSETPIRVGAPGIGVERGDVRRMPWWAVKKITFESGSLSLVIVGSDESGAAWTFKVPMKAHPEAVAWIVKEALHRVPKVVDISDSKLEQIPEASPHAGMKIELDPLQVAGKKCAASGKAISYEPDARVCNRCERIYFKRNVPKKCKCGAGLDHLREGSIQEEDEDAPHEDDEEEATAKETEGA